MNARALGEDLSMTRISGPAIVQYHTVHTFYLLIPLLKSSFSKVYRYPTHLPFTSTHTHQPTFNLLYRITSRFAVQINMPTTKRPREDTHLPAPAPAPKRPRVSPDFRAQPLQAGVKVPAPIESSPEPDHADPPAWYTAYRNEPVSGILPRDSFQDIAIPSVEEGRLGLSGCRAYRHFLAEQPEYPNIQVTFKSRKRRKRHAGSSRSFDSHRDRAPKAAPRQPHYDYTRPPEAISRSDYEFPIYAGTTYNPTIPLAITRLAEQNLPCFDFVSAREHLPNMGATTEYPVEADRIDFLDLDVEHERQASDSRIHVLFLPEYYQDGRHALGFCTLKMPSRRLGSMLFTPCTDEDLLSAHLKRAVGDGGDWEAMEVGVAGGTWWDPRDVEDGYWEWARGFRLVATDWQQRLQLTTRQLLEGG